MLTKSARLKIRDAFNQIDTADLDLHCGGKILFNFQLNTTVDIDEPFKRQDGDYEGRLAEYFIGREQGMATNGGGLVIIRGATGSGKTTAIKKAKLIAEKQLLAEGGKQELKTIFLQFNNIHSADESDTNYIWREFSNEIDREFDKEDSLVDSLEFIQWMKNKTNISNQIPNLFRYYEKNRDLLAGVASGNGYLKFSVEDLKEKLMDDWRASFETFSDEEIAKRKLAHLRYQIEKNQPEPFQRVIIIDNVDHLPPSLQVKIVDLAIWVSEFLDVKMLIAVRPLTWENQHGHKTLDVEEHLSPSLSEVIQARLNQLLRESGSADSDLAHGIQWLVNDLGDAKSHLKMLLYGTSGISVRAALRNMYNFLSSPLLDSVPADHMRPSELARAFFFGAEQAIDHDNIDNLFSVRNVRSSSITLLKPRIIDYIARVKGGRANLEEIFEFIQNFGFPPNEITRAIDELLLRKRSMIWSNSFFRLDRRTEVKDQAVIAIAPIGISYYSKLFGEYLYTEACLASTQKQTISPTDVVEFSRRLIIEDESQIEHFLSCASATVYYSAYGLDFPSIAFGYWKRFERGALARRSSRYDSQIYDPGWESRIRGFVQGKTGKRYLDAQKA